MLACGMRWRWSPLLIIVALASPVSAQYRPQTVVVEQPSSLEVGGQYYDASIGGLRDYLESIRTTQPDLYANLDPEVSSLETRQTIAVLSMVGGGVIGLGLMFFPLIVPGPDCNAMYDIFDPERDRCEDDNLTRLLTFLGVGMGVALAGLLVFLIVKPGRGDMLEVLNRHNRISPTQMRLQLGYDAVRESVVAALQWHFDLL